jgi:hypothetical protein
MWKLMKSDVYMICCRGWPESKSYDFVGQFNLNMANENSRLDFSQEGLYLIFSTKFTLFGTASI